MLYDTIGGAVLSMRRGASKNICGERKAVRQASLPPTKKGGAPVDAERLSIARGRLMKASPWLAPLFGRLEAEARPGAALPGTDGARFFYDPEWLRDAVADGRASAALAHSTLHCLLGHVFDRAPDGLAADMAVALAMDRSLREFCPFRDAELFRQAKHRLAGVPLNGVAGAMAADDWFIARRAALGELLRLDGHGDWIPEGARLFHGGAGEGWSGARRRFLSGMGGRRAGTGAGTRAVRARLGEAPDRSYRALLERYAGVREEAREDPDGFEYGMYAYGLRRYGNMPIIEPAESREARHIDELAIVIDTSGSCMEELTLRFLNETRAMIADEALFARRFNLRVIQCDAKVQRDDHITCLRDFEAYIDHLELLGGGGTDFRPAFERIDRLVRRGAFRRLGAALFLSDGMGIFPSAPSEYETVFIFFKDRYDAIDVPGWVRRVVLEEALH